MNWLQNVGMWSVGTLAFAAAAHAADSEVVVPAATPSRISIEVGSHADVDKDAKKSDKTSTADKEEALEQEPLTQVPAAEEIDRRLLRISSRWGRLRLSRAETKLDLGFFNQRGPEVFRATPEGLKAATSSYNYRMGSFVTGLFAGAVYLADFVYVAARLSNSNPWDRTDTLAGICMLAGGLILHGTSSLLNNAANDRLGRAVGYENEHVVLTTLRPQRHPQAALVPVRGGAVASLGLAF